MARLRMLLSAVSLSITMLLWPPTSPAEPKSCADNMNDIYKKVESLAGDDYLINRHEKALVSGKAQEYIKDTLPGFKAACPTEAKSIKDLENGNYLKKLAAIRKQREKAERHIKWSTEISDSELLQDLSLQQ
jgi:hypothetical protein